MTLKAAQGHRNSLSLLYHFLLVICSDNVSMLYQFRDITTFTVYVTACDLEKSFSFNKTVDTISHVYAIILESDVSTFIANSCYIC